MTFWGPQVRGRAWGLALGVFALMGIVSQANAARTELDLSGTWQYQNVSQLTFPPTNNWQSVTVPGFLSGWQYQHAWFRTTFVLPPAMAGTQLKLKFGGVKYNAQVWLNGTLLGSYLNGYNPFEFDITGAALIGQTNELIVGVTDWTATFAQPVDFSNLPAGENARHWRALRTLWHLAAGQNCQRSARVHRRRVCDALGSVQPAHGSPDAAQRQCFPANRQYHQSCFGWRRHRLVVAIATNHGRSRCQHAT